MLKPSDRISQARPVADWVAVHGNAIISDASRPVNISHHPREAVITPKVGTDHWSTGVVHFALPSAPNGSVKPMKLLINFETTMARPYKVEIYYGGSEVFQLNLSEDDTLECLDISSISPFGVQRGRCGHGINVSITIDFRQTNSKISFESVGMVFSK
jgi:hypothetical protein